MGRYPNVSGLQNVMSRRNGYLLQRDICCHMHMLHGRKLMLRHNRSGGLDKTLKRIFYAEPNVID
jgi:hypothetical protein